MLMMRHSSSGARVGAATASASRHNSVACAPPLRPSGSDARDSSASATATASPAGGSAGDTVLLLGVTGVTGRCALEGLLAGGLAPSRLVAVSRDPASPASRLVASRGVAVVAGDLDAPESLRARVAAAGGGVYCHALSGDAASADPSELRRGEALARLVAEAAASGSSGGSSQAPPLVVYNSSAGRGCGAGISQMDQKHAVEDALAARGAPLLALEATMFMEELLRIFTFCILCLCCVWSCPHKTSATHLLCSLDSPPPHHHHNNNNNTAAATAAVVSWKRYTRPGLVERGAFAFSLPPDRPLQLVAARDVGLVAAAALASPDPGAWAGRRLPLAGDELTPRQMCAAFSAAQGGAPVVQRALPAWLFWFLSRDLYRITRFLSTRGFDADAAACRAQLPGLLTFAEFLAATRWGDATRRYEDGVRFDGPLPQRPVLAAPSSVPAVAVPIGGGRGGQATAGGR